MIIIVVCKNLVSAFVPAQHSHKPNDIKWSTRRKLANGSLRLRLRCKLPKRATRCERYYDTQGALLSHVPLCVADIFFNYCTYGFHSRPLLD